MIGVAKIPPRGVTLIFPDLDLRCRPSPRKNHQALPDEIFA